MIASNLPGSATHSCLASSKKLNAFLSIVSVTTFSSPGANFTFWKPFKLFYRTRERGFLITDIKLNNLLTFTSACILHIDCERNGIICSHCFLVGRGFSIGESSVAQSVSEREQRFDFLFIRPAITYENIFPIDFINGVPSMLRLCQLFFITRIFAQFMSTYIFQFCREGERKFFLKD